MMILFKCGSESLSGAHKHKKTVKCPTGENIGYLTSFAQAWEIVLEAIESNVNESAILNQ